MNELVIKYMAIKDLTPYEKNARKHEEKDISAIMASIREFGFDDPVGIWSDKNIIVEGHGRVMAAERLGMTEVPCIRLDHLTDEQRRAYALAHNRTAELSDWDFVVRDDELQGITEIDMEQFGFELSNISDTMEASEDNYDGTVPEEPKAKLGDIYQLGNHRLICGDSTDVNVIDRLMNGEKADMIFTDPPYGVDYAGKNAFLNTISRGNRIQTDIKGDNLDNAEQEKDELWTPAFKNAREYADDYCAYYVASPQGGELMMMMMALQEAGWQLKHTIIWNKNNHVPGRSDYNYKHEPLLYGWNKQHMFYGKGQHKTSVWDIPKPLKSDLHPTMKPVELVGECILNNTVESDNILDIFGGSGTTLIACEQLNRKCFMCELDPHYVDVIIDRWETLTGKKAVLLSEEN